MSAGTAVSPVCQLLCGHLPQKCLCRKEDVPEIVRQSDADVFILLGAGDLESYAPQITEVLEER